MNDSQPALTPDESNPRTNGRVAVIGAGISGLTCARLLVGEGYQVTVFDKSRGVGGRMSTRRTADSLQFDHGAQYFTVRDPRFAEYVDRWLHDGVVDRWHGRIVVLESGTIREEKTNMERFVATPRMSAICKHLAKGIDVRLETEVTPPRRTDGLWHLSSGTEKLGVFDTVVVSAPPAQASVLLAASPGLASTAALVAMNGCWALMLAFDQPSRLEYSGAFVHGSPISWIARNSDKPGRAPSPETWVVHASGDWSGQHIDQSRDHVAEILREQFWKVTALAPRPVRFMSAHRWRYALPPEPLAASCLFDDERQLGACGDWCAGPRVEGAFLSGISVAAQVLLKS